MSRLLMKWTYSPPIFVTGNWTVGSQNDVVCLHSAWSVGCACGLACWTTTTDVPVPFQAMREVSFPSHSPILLLYKYAIIEDIVEPECRQVNWKCISCRLRNSIVQSLKCSQLKELKLVLIVLWELFIISVNFTIFSLSGCVSHLLL